MKIKEIKEGTRNIYLSNVEVVESTISEVDTRKGKMNVANGIIKDETGEIKIKAWDRGAEALNTAKRIDVKNCFCKSYDGELEIGTGFYGRVIKLD